MNHNSLLNRPNACVLFVDMNSFFATCEQQVNYWTRHRPVCVCVYTGRHGVIISPSVEAKRLGIKLGMRLNEAIKICPHLIPLETNPGRYREFHIKVMDVLRKYSNDVIPKSIDEAVVDLTDYRLIYKDPVQTARNIKMDITRYVGDWMKCSIGIAPNAFLAKLGSDLMKPDGLVGIFPDNIDEVLKNLKLTDLPGISHRTAERLHRAGIHNPLQIRYEDPGKLKRACGGINGLYWHYRLNFREIDQRSERYKSMQARRAISSEQRRHVHKLEDLFLGLCLKLERRMVKESVFCREIGFFSTYENGTAWNDFFRTDRPIQDGIELLRRIKKRMAVFEKEHGSESIINDCMTSMGVSVASFVPADFCQLHLFEDNVRKDNLRKVVYDVKDKYGNDKLFRAIELRDEELLKDAIGFGSVKDLHAQLSF